jgi:hypothetical protein
VKSLYRSRAALLPSQCSYPLPVGHISTAPADVTIGAAQSLYADGVLLQDSGAVGETSREQKIRQTDEHRYVYTVGL